MSEPLSTVGLIDFVQNYTTRRMNRFLNARIDDLFDKPRKNASQSSSDSSSVKSKPIVKTKTVSRGQTVELRDVDSHSFSEIVLSSNKVNEELCLCVFYFHSILFIFRLFSYSSIRRNAQCARCWPRPC